MWLISFSLIPLIKPDKSPTGTRIGKSRIASMSARKSHHTAIAVTNNDAPAAYRVVSREFQGVDASNLHIAARQPVQCCPMQC
jgi:hypothetical protein